MTLQSLGKAPGVAALLQQRDPGLCSGPGLSAVEFPHKFGVCTFLNLGPSSTESASDKI